MIRGLAGLNFVGADIVEVSPGVYSSQTLFIAYLTPHSL